MTCLVSELVRNQLPDVLDCYKLEKRDMVRLSSGLTSSCFNPSNCCYWTSYAYSNIKPHRQYKGVHVKFWLRGYKLQLHRLLYQNYVKADLSGQYLKCTCNNVLGYCLNLNHYVSHSYKLNVDKPPPSTRRHARVKKANQAGKDPIVKVDIRLLNPCLSFDLKFQ